jgi:2',3'-cyclic-nucleotide 2'-phosphodiesterase (5'-nucleotidase family)
MKKTILLLLLSLSILFGTELSIAVTGNNRGTLTPCGCRIPSGGWARIKTLADQIDGPQLRVAAGNQFFHHTPIPKEDQIFEQKKAVFQAGMFAELNYDVINVGQFDLCYGLNVLRSYKENYSLPLISANLLDMNGDPAFPPYKIAERNGMKIMFIGICTLEDGFNFKVADPMKTLILLYEDKVFEQADFVILLADAPAKLLTDFAREFDGIDLIIASKDYTYTGLPIHYRNTALVQMGSQGKYFGTLKLHVKETDASWEDISPVRHQIQSLKSMQNNEPDKIKKTQRLLKQRRKQLKKIERSKKNYFDWHMTLMDSSVKDDPAIKEQVETYMPYP